MVLISQYSTQGSSAIPKLWSKEVKLRPFVTLQMVGRLNMSSAPFKGHSFTSRRPQLILQRDVKHLKSSCTKESGSITSGSTVSLNFGGEPPKGNASESHNQIESKKRGVKILKAMWHYCLGLVKRILKIPKAILLLWYFVITVLNGSEPTREQIPLWVLDTMIFCLYIMVWLTIVNATYRYFDVELVYAWYIELERFFKLR